MRGPLSMAPKVGDGLFAASDTFPILGKTTWTHVIVWNFRRIRVADTDDALDEHETDQVRAEAHRIVDEAKELLVIGIEKDGTVIRAKSLTDSGCVTMMGALEYQIHNIKKYLDWIHNDDDDNPSGTDED